MYYEEQHILALDSIHRPLRIKRPGFRLGAADSVAFSKAGRLLGQTGRRVAVYDVAHRKVAVKSEWHYPHPASITFGDQEDWFAVRSTTGAIVVAGFPSGAPLSRLAPSSGTADDSPLVTAPDEHLVEACSSGTLRVRRANGLRVEYVEQHPNFMLGRIASSDDRFSWAIAFNGKSQDGKTLARGRIELRAWPFTTASRTVIAEHEGTVEAIAMSGNGETLAVLKGRPGETLHEISLLATRTGNVIAESRSTAWRSHKGFTWSRDGRWFVVGTETGHELLDGSLRSAGHLKGEYSSDAAFAPGSTLLALGYWGKGLVIPTADIRDWFRPNYTRAQSHQTEP